ncbi:MAG: hypothetical protein AMJ46_12520 [Latescibacteria bacterium DG_63]|nr:MAG: hypothetical protein AMJ46_12520 [Latescibacteria bacterium DG_63]
MIAVLAVMPALRNGVSICLACGAEMIPKGKKECCSEEENPGCWKERRAAVLRKYRTNRSPEIEQHQNALRRQRDRKARYAKS